MASQTLAATLSTALSAGDAVFGSLDSGITWTNITGSVTGTVLTWSGVTLLPGGNTLQLKVVDVAGNSGAVKSQAYVLDNHGTRSAEHARPDQRQWRIQHRWHHQCRHPPVDQYGRTGEHRECV